MNSGSCVAGSWSKRPFSGRLVCHGVSRAMTVRSVPLHGTVVAERLLK